VVDIGRHLTPPGLPAWNQHLVTEEEEEEEVYAYNILSGWPFPDHMNDQGVINFAARELGATDFIPSLT